MPKFICTAISVDDLEETIEAENENKAYEIFDKDLEDGAVPRIGLGSIEDRVCFLVRDEEAKKVEEINRRNQ